MPWWKVKRELLRLKEQAVGPIRVPVERLLNSRYERDRWTKIRVSGQSDVQNGKFCVLLVYQQGTFPKSLIRTCNYMVAQGYNLLVVANGGLSDDIRETIVDHAWRVLERPNYGYDFGGFRDAIHFLQMQGARPENLILMNDSIWFPMWSGSDVVARMEASEHDITGLLYHVPSRNGAVIDKKARRPGRMRAEHIESYVTMIKPRVFFSEAFGKFWMSYEQTNSKILTIKRGEVGFSKAMARAGFSVSGISSRQSFLQKMNASSDQFIEETLRYAAYSDHAHSEERQALLDAPRDGTWRERCLHHIGTVVQRRRFNASFCWATEQFFQTSFLKKNPDRLFQVGRIRFLEAIEKGAIPCDNAEALAELKALVASEKRELYQST